MAGHSTIRSVLGLSAILLSFALWLCSPQAAVATPIIITYDFAGSPGQIGQSADFTSSGQTITVSAWRVTDGGLTYSSDGLTLYQRNDPTVNVGLGVCLVKKCASGNNQEIDDHGGVQEVIRVDLTNLPPLTSSLIGAWLESVNGVHNGIDHYAIYGSDLVNPILTPSASVTLLASGDPSGGVTPYIPLTGFYNYLYFTTAGSKNGDDYLLGGLVLDPDGRPDPPPLPPPSVPEPAAILLLGAGLAGLGAWRAWQRKSGPRS